MRAGEVEEVDDIAEADAVDHIADRPAHDQADGGDQQAAIDPERPPAEDAGDGDLEGGEHPPRRAIAEQAEADPAVFDPGQVEEGGQDLDLPHFAQLQTVHHPSLGQLVEDDDEEGEAEGGVGDAGDFHSGR